MAHIDFKNLRLCHIKCSQSHNLIAAFGLRSCILLNRDLVIKHHYLDANKGESFLCCDFYLNSDQNLFLIIAGESGVIKILDVKNGVLDSYLIGHTGAIRDLQVFDNYLVTCSEDSSLRIWDLIKMQCIQTMGGLLGHKDFILSLDITKDGKMIVSTGVDCTIRQWKIRDFKKYFNYNPFSIFKNILKNQITCVRYYGNMILSLSGNLISMVYNNTAPTQVQSDLGMSSNDPIFMGNIQLYDSCVSFLVIDHILLSLSSIGDIYLFDLRKIINENTPLIIESHVPVVEDFCYADGFVYISAGDSIHKIQMNPDIFN